MTWRTWALAATAVLAAPAWAQPADGGIDPKPANPGENEAPAVIRQLDEAAPAAAPEAEEPFEERKPQPKPMQYEVTPAGPAAEEPALAEPAKKQATGWDFSAALAASARVNYGGATLFPLSADGVTAPISPLQTRVRVTPEIHLGGFGLVGEADTASGEIFGQPGTALVGDRRPIPAFHVLELRKLYLEYKWASGVFRVGQQTSNWGLGLLANDGAQDPEAGDFGQKNWGNLTYRALLAARPLFGRGGGWRGLETVLAADLIVRDNFGEYARGDRAFQGVAALRFAKDQDNHFGVYAVYRNQRNVFVTDGGKATDAVVIDFAGKWDVLKRRHRHFKLGWELVGITGTTTQARNENADVLKLGQLGLAIKSSYRVGRTTLYLDGGYASGDQNTADDRIENFRFDRDYKVGLVLFDQVMAYQSGRSGVRAADPALTGVAPEGADLLGTAGSITGAWYLFPRLKIAMSDWLDAFGGPLFAFSTARLADAYNSRLGGGTAVNPLGARPGLYLGTEVDLGVQARFKPIPELLVTATGEGGLFVPGDAYTLPGGGTMAPVGFGRVRLSVSL